MGRYGFGRDRWSARRRRRPIGPGPPKPLDPGMSGLLMVAAVLVFLAGVQLFVFTGRTDEYFAWTIGNPMTAAFLGAAYWSSVAIEALAARERWWANARIAVPTVFVFTVLTLVVTLAHLDKFHLGSDFGLVTQLVTWLWIAIYILVPVLLIAVFIAQVRKWGSDPSRGAPLQTWLLLTIGAQALVLLVLGSVLLIAPAQGAKVWPWALTPLTGRAIGAWLFSLGVAAAHTLIERDARRVRAAAVGSVVLAVLQAAALARYPSRITWESASAIVYLIVLASFLLVGVATLARASEADQG